MLIIDTGIDPSNPRIREVLCPNSDHLNTAGDGGLPLSDKNGHGTHIAGIIRALAGNKGYCLASCQYYNGKQTGWENLIASTKCLKHANTIKAQIVNLSGGGPEFSQEEYETIRTGKFTLFTAAGNEGQNLDLPSESYYPGEYSLPNVVMVGATDIKGNRTPTSNFGTRVKVSKPGENIYSVLTGTNSYGYLSGTSQATAIATGDHLRGLIGLGALQTARDYYVWLVQFWKNQPFLRSE